MINFKKSIHQISSFAIVVLLTIMGCETDTELTVIPTYIRVMDMRNSNVNDGSFDAKFFQSAFRFDGHYYGNPAFDTITIPTQHIDGHGDFLLGRVASLSSIIAIGQRQIISATHPYSFTGMLDYFVMKNVNNLDYVLFQPYKQGEWTGENVNLIDYSPISMGRNVCFPNLSHRHSLAPIMQGIDYFKWAKFSAGSHTIGFSKVQTDFTLGQQASLTIQHNKFLEDPFIADAPYYFKQGGIYSLLLVSEFVADFTKARLLHIQEDENFSPDPTKAYIRFINAIPISQTAVDDDTESLDIYVRQIDNGELNELRKDTINFYDPRFLNSTTPEKLVVNDLKRFGQDGQVPYVAVDYSDFLKRNDTTKNSVNKRGVPSFIFYAYPHGESQATGGIPLKQYQYVLTNIKIMESIESQPNVIVLPSFIDYTIQPYIPALAFTTKGYVPTITTIVLGTEKLSNGSQVFTMGYSIEQADVRQSFLDYKNR